MDPLTAGNATCRTRQEITKMNPTLNTHANFLTEERASS
jgi:hypothetical protein